MKAEKAELFELFLHDVHGIGLVEFSEFNNRTISKRNGIKFQLGGRTQYLSENKIDSYRVSRFPYKGETKYIIACTSIDPDKAVKSFKDFYKSICEFQILSHSKIENDTGFFVFMEAKT